MALRAFWVAAAALFVAVARWAWLTRMNYDEGIVFSAIQSFAREGVPAYRYLGHWGGSWNVSTGPAVTAPLGALGYLTGIHVGVTRLVLFAAFTGIFALCCRLVGLRLRAIPAAFALFLLWTACMPGGSFTMGSSLNLVANLYGEGLAFAFLLAANLASAREEQGWRDAYWVLALLAAGTKVVALLGLAFPVAWMAYDALAARSLKPLGLRGLAGALTLAAAWQAWLFARLGSGAYAEQWAKFLDFLHWGGGAPEGGLAQRKFNFLTLWETGGHPYVALAMWVVAIAVVYRLWRERSVPGGPALPERWRTTIAFSAALFAWWFFFFSGRGWMRHLWIAHALLGWLAVASLTRRLDRGRRHAGAAVAAMAIFLFVLAASYGSLRDLGKVPEPYRWRAQRDFALRMREKHPRARIYAAGWRSVPQIGFFLDVPLHNLEEEEVRPRDLVACDVSAGCVPDPYLRYDSCAPTDPGAEGIGYCVQKPFPPRSLKPAYRHFRGVR